MDIDTIVRLVRWILRRENGRAAISARLNDTDLATLKEKLTGSGIILSESPRELFEGGWFYLATRE